MSAGDVDDHDELRKLLATPATRALLLRLYSEASLGRTISGLVHQLRNPLNSILNGAQLLEEREASDVLQAKLLPVILRSGQRAGETLDALDQHLEPGRDCHDLRELLQHCLRLLRDLAMNVEVHGGPGAPLWVHGQRHELYPMLLCLLQSHLAYNPRKLELRFVSHPDLSEVQLINVQGDDWKNEAGWEIALQSALAESLGGTLHRDLQTARSTLALPTGVP